MSIVIPKSAQRWPVEQKGQKNGDKKKMKQSKAYSSAKTLNDREQRRLALTLDVFKKDLRSATHLVSLEQKQLRRELQLINPDIEVDPAKGFFVPQGVTQEQAERLKDNRRASAPTATRSISLAEFDEMRQKRSQRTREAFESYRVGLAPPQEGKEGEDAMMNRARRRGRRGAVHIENKPATFTSMARVINPARGKGNTAFTKQAASSLRKLNQNK